MNRGDIITRGQFTGNVYVRPAGDGGYIDFGDLNGHKNPIVREGGTLTVQEKGYHRRVRNDTQVVGIEYEFNLREGFKEGLAILNAANGLNANAVSTGGDNKNFAIGSVTPGLTYRLGDWAVGGPFLAVNIDLVTLNIGGVAKVEGTDYTIDRGSGLLYILPTGTIAAGAAIQNTSSYTTQGGDKTFNEVTRLSKPQYLQGDVILHEFDQHAAGGVPRRVHAFTGQYWVEGAEEHDGKKVTERTLKILAVTKPTLAVLKS